MRVLFHIRKLGSSKRVEDIFKILNKYSTVFQWNAFYKNWDSQVELLIIMCLDTVLLPLRPSGLCSLFQLLAGVSGLEQLEDGGLHLNNYIGYNIALLETIVGKDPEGFVENGSTLGPEVVEDKTLGLWILDLMDSFGVDRGLGKCVSETEE